jgi:transcriptional regulator with XRE-family HTH domain
MDEGVSYFVRRARLLQGKTQAHFAELFGVDASTVSRWERGTLNPSPLVWRKIRNINTKHGSLLSDAAIKASPVLKYLVHMENLNDIMMISKGAAASLAQLGYTPDDMYDTALLSSDARASPHFSHSSYLALDKITKHPRWRNGEVAYAEAHCFSTRLNIWLDLMVAPLPDRYAALIEAVPSHVGTRGGFWVQLTFTEHLPRSERIG